MKERRGEERMDREEMTGVGVKEERRRDTDSGCSEGGP
jgi:hypothetical protein